MILNCWIVDDEPLALELLSSYVQKTPFLSLTGKFSNAVQAMKEMNDTQIDIIFLDIQMPEVNGMEFARFVETNTRIIFTTAFSEYALDGYKVNAIDYLLKPFSYADFLDASKKALKWHEMRKAANEKKDSKANGLFVRSDYKLIHIKYNEIFYIEGLKDYIKIHTSTDAKPILTLMSLKTMEEQLPSASFVRIHRSYIINRNSITAIDKNMVVINAKQIPIGDTYRKAFMDSIEK